MSSQQTKLASVVMATYNGATTIERALKSIAKQDYRPLEIIVVDDGSTDTTWEILQRRVAQTEGLIILRNESNSGLAASLNRGITASSGAYIVRLDDDDEMVDLQRITKQVAFLEENLEYVLVGSFVELYFPQRNEKLLRRLHTEDEELRRQFFAGINPFVHPAVAFRRSTFLDVGGYDESFATTQDLDLFMRLAMRGKIHNIPKPLTRFYVNPSSVSSRQGFRQARDVLWAIYKNHHALKISKLMLVKSLTLAALRRYLAALLPRSPIMQVKTRLLKYFAD